MRAYLFSILFLSALLLFSWTSAVAQDSGKIKDFETEVEEGGSDSHEHGDYDDGHYHSAVADDDTWFFAEMFFRTFIMFPKEDSILYGSPARFNAYPYADGSNGWYNYYDDDKSARQVAMNFTANRFYNSASLEGTGLRGRAIITPYFSLSGQYTHLVETLELQKDHIEFYSAFANFNRLRLESLNVWWGAGIKGMRGSLDHVGPAFNLGMDAFIFKPVSFHGNYSLGSLNSRAVSEIYLRLNAHVNRMVFYLGYQDFNVGRVSLNGFVYGLGIHL